VENYESLTEREIQVMVLYSNPYLEKTEIAASLAISITTLNWHISNIFSKLGETDRYPASFRFFQLYPSYRYLIVDYIAS
jgi:LuxR family maltose regulon positive regulatory protein